MKLLPVYFYLFALLLIQPIFTTIEIPISNIQERKIIIVIPSYNNPLEITRECLNSVLMQDYPNFEILFCDDCSPQSNIEEMHRSLIEELDKDKKITYRRNLERYGPIGNQWHACHSINPDNSQDNREIIIATLDGDDVFLHTKVLQEINELHQYAWVTYGNFAYYPSLAIDRSSYEVPAEIIAANAWRTVPGFPTTHLRTARLSLIKDLPLEAVLYDDRFYPAAGDTTWMWSQCEKAGQHAVFNSDIIYGYRITDQAENKVMPQLHQDCAVYARNQKPFEPLKELPFQKSTDFYDCDLIIFSYKRPMQLYALLESLEEYVSGLNKIIVLYRADEDRYEQSYNLVKADFENVIFVQQSNQPLNDFQPLLLDYLQTSTSEYIMFATDDDLVLNHIYIKDCIQALQKTHAYGFYLRLGKNLKQSYMANSPQALPTFISIDTTICAWRINPSQYNLFFDWVYPNTVDMTIYPKEKIITAIKKLSFSNPNTFEGNWAQLAHHEPSKIGLCFNESKIVNISISSVQDVSPINRNMGQDPQELLELFEKGFKIDRSLFNHWSNLSAHAEFGFVFTQR